ncbi:hypothetical protein BaRGS_00021855 [Batillaria attramentaria]|uniref:Uncharacterized protein n=1 Tax=Batillaria attramentaria TaxID=370345 RepID=A0ABD0KI88_9CAEN
MQAGSTSPRAVYPGEEEKLKKQASSLGTTSVPSITPASCWSLLLPPPPSPHRPPSVAKANDSKETAGDLLQ